MYDVIIAGSGPAGATAANLLAQQQHNVLMIERSQHPKFHIGESMLPMSTPVFQRLGIHWDTDRYLHKNGAQFIDEKSGQQVRFALNGCYQPYQVERAIFDEMMVGKAVSRGARLHESETVKKVEIDAKAVRVSTDQDSYRARYFIDATGRSAFMGRVHSSIQRIDNLGRFALYTHYRKATSPAALKMYESGDIKVLMLDIGWFWIIPLSGQRLSVGIVVKNTEQTNLRGAALFEKYLDESPFLQELLQGAEQETAIQTEADFSFTNQRRHGLRYACCGDAAGFLDPIFSSGVFLAVTSAEKVADRLHQALVDGKEGDPGLHIPDDEHYQLGFLSMQLFVERYYRYNMVEHLFFEADRNEAVKRNIAALLSGDLWRGDNDFQRMLLEGRQRNHQGS